MIPGIKSAIVEILNDNAAVREWATGGIHARRAPKGDGRRDKYIVVRVSECDPDESHTQNDAASVSKDVLDVSVWASNSREADHAANLVRFALDAMAGDAAGITILRIFWRGTTDREVEDASRAEQLMDACQLVFEVGYRLPTGEE